MKESFVFYRSFYEAIRKIKDYKLKSEIYDAICELGLNKNVVKLTDDVGQIIMDLIKPQIEANTERYENGKKGGKFGILGGRPKKEKNPSGVINKTPNENDNVNVNDNVNDNESERESKERDSVLSSTPSLTPTLSELRSYCYENDMSGFDYDNFYNYYEANGWINKNGTPIKNWKAKVNYWYKKDLETGKIKIDTRRRLD